MGVAAALVVPSVHAVTETRGGSCLSWLGRELVALSVVLVVVGWGACLLQESVCRCRRCGSELRTEMGYFKTFV